LPALFIELSKLDLARLHIHTARDVTSCPGADTCNLAVTASRRLAAAIAERLEEPDARDLPAIAKTTLKVSGCPNSCGQHHIADIGFHGGAKTFHDAGGRTVPIYQLHLGGGVDEHGARFGKQIVKLIARRVPEAVVRLLRLYDAHHTSGESPKTFFARVDPKLVTAALSTLLTAPTGEDEVDIGETSGFVVETREGECAA
jgi:sulfite reductase beta subunit-like hemoprotein